MLMILEHYKIQNRDYQPVITASLRGWWCFLRLQLKISKLSQVSNPALYESKTRDYNLDCLDQVRVGLYLGTISAFSSSPEHVTSYEEQTVHHEVWEGVQFS